MSYCYGCRGPSLGGGFYCKACYEDSLVPTDHDVPVPPPSEDKTGPFQEAVTVKATTELCDVCDGPTVNRSCLYCYHLNRRRP